MKYVLLLILSAFSIASQAQSIDAKSAKNSIKAVKASLKSGAKLDESAKSLCALLAQEPYSKDPSLWDMAGRVQRAVYDAENKKLYLRQKYDTLKMYNACYSMFKMFIKCDSVETEVGKYVFRKKNSKDLSLLRRNLLFMGRHFQQRNSLSDAYRFYTLYISSASEPLFADECYATRDTLMDYARYLAIEVAAGLKDNEGVLSNKILAESNSQYGEYALEQIAIAYSNLSDTSNMAVALRSGVERFPKNSYFFAHLIDFYNSKNDYKGALDYADEMVRRDSTSAYYLFVKGYVLQQMEQYDLAIQFLLRSYAIDSQYKPVVMSLGYCYFTKAGTMYKNLFQNRKKKNYRQEMEMLYSSARKYYEQLRSAEPANRDLWYDWLYTIYYRLNLGKELQELEN